MFYSGAVKKSLYILIIIVSVLTACIDRREYASMRQGLDSLNERNRNDKPFTAADVQPYIDYFDRHGEPNDRLLAYYLLGRAYHEQGEAPMALEQYHKAIECADTLSHDCDFGQLSRVYSQMGDLCCKQNLYQSQLYFSHLSSYYAYKGQDTLTALLIYATDATAYDLLGNIDSTIIVSVDAYQRLLKHGYKEDAAATIGLAITALLKKGDLTLARKYMDIYEAESGFFDQSGNIERDREVYYYDKGEYCLAINKLDSAESYFRKELMNGKDYINQNAGARGLAKLFTAKHMSDSAAKYALYSYEMNDSLYAQMATGEVSQMQAIYNYSRQQQIAQREYIRAENNSRWLQVSIAAIIFLGMLTYIIVYKEKHKRKLAYQKYIDSLNNLEQAEVELKLMKQHEKVFGNLIAEKEKNVKHLENIVQQYESSRGKIMPKDEKELFLSAHYKYLESLSNRGAFMSTDDWQKTEELINLLLPDFCEFLSANRERLTENELKVCLLTRLHFKPQSIGFMIDLSAASISKIRINLLNKLYGVEGKPSDFDKRIVNI